MCNTSKGNGHNVKKFIVYLILGIIIVLANTTV